MSFFTIQCADDHTYFDIVELNSPISIIQLAKKIIYVISNDIPFRNLPSSLLAFSSAFISVPELCKSLLSTALSTSKEPQQLEDLDVCQKVLVHLNMLINMNFLYKKTPSPAASISSSLQYPLTDTSHIEEATKQALTSLTKNELSMLDQCLQILNGTTTSSISTTPTIDPTNAFSSVSTSSDLSAAPSSQLIPATNTLSSALKRKITSPLTFPEKDHSSTKQVLPAIQFSSLETPEYLSASDEEETEDDTISVETPTIPEVSVATIEHKKHKSHSSSSKNLIKSSSLIFISQNNIRIHIYISPIIKLRKTNRIHFKLSYKTYHCRDVVVLSLSIRKSIQNHMLMTKEILSIIKNNISCKFEEQECSLVGITTLLFSNNKQILICLLQSLLTIQAYFTETWPLIIKSKDIEKELTSIVSELKSYLQDKYKYTNEPSLKLTNMEKVYLMDREMLKNRPPRDGIIPLRFVSEDSTESSPYKAYIFTLQKKTSTFTYFYYSCLISRTLSYLYSNSRRNIKKTCQKVEALLNAFPTSIQFHAKKDSNTPIASKKEVFMSILDGILEMKLYHQKHLPQLLSESVRNQIESTISKLVAEIDPSLPLKTESTVLSVLAQRPEDQASE